jgi:ABC-type transport system involved in cytochrome bd biosynthesis fused ATPase/permease subunit
MTKNICLVERISKAGIGLFFLVTGFAFLISGVTVFPFFGFLMAVPAFFASAYFFYAHLNKSCEIVTK